MCNPCRGTLRWQRPSDKLGLMRVNTGGKLIGAAYQAWLKASQEGANMNKIILTAIGVLTLTGCVSTEMKRFLGKPIEETFITYGQPENVFEFPDGRRAYQYRWGGGSFAMAGRGSAIATSTGNITTVQTTYTPATIMNSPGCLITYIARNNGTGFIVEEYRFPKKLVC